MNKAHENQNWKNKPSLETPLNDVNLNKLDRSVDTIDDRVIVLDTTKANQTDMLQTISDITFNKNTGIFTVYRKNGTSFTIDTDLEKISINFDYDDNPSSEHYQQLIITLIDGTVKYIDMSALITQYEFVDSNQIHFAVNAEGKISATIIAGSITEVMLEPNFLANCRLEVSKAEGFADEAEAWATGKRNGTDIPSTDPAYENNAEFYAGIAGTKAAEASVSEANALSSANNAHTSETNAATSASNALASENAARTYKNSATDSALAASNSATTAVSAENSARTSATNAANSASAAASSEANAANSETNAASSAEYAGNAQETIENIIAGVRPNARGRWDASETYELLDLVYYNYNTWLARRENTNVPPSEGADWQLFAASPDNIVLSQTLLAGETELTFTDDHITDTAMVEMFTDVYGITVRDMQQSGHSVTITFKAMEVDVEIKLTVREG